MNLEVMADGASRFAAYVEELTKMIDPADRARSLKDCCAGLLVSEGRRSVEPMAAVTPPAETSVQRHFVANAPWSDEPCWPKYGEMVVSAMERHGPIETWIFEDRSFPKTRLPLRQLLCGRAPQHGPRDYVRQLVMMASFRPEQATSPLAPINIGSLCGFQRGCTVYYLEACD